ncbi:hypothetical protein [Planococcus dechangensis]|uniref:Uncharacterized protein n=1 Tax=Planococcus dechangensis TaxID=1176255 RepID=A0ABV9MEF8_9BACL
MMKTANMFSTGLIMFMAGVYLSTSLSTLAVAVGAGLAAMGGYFRGGAVFFLPKPNGKSN